MNIQYSLAQASVHVNGGRITAYLATMLLLLRCDVEPTYKIFVPTSTDGLHMLAHTYASLTQSHPRISGLYSRALPLPISSQNEVASGPPASQVTARSPLSEDLSVHGARNPATFALILNVPNTDLPALKIRLHTPPLGHPPTETFLSPIPLLRSNSVYRGIFVYTLRVEGQLCKFLSIQGHLCKKPLY